MLKKTSFCFYLIVATIAVLAFSYLFQNTQGLLYIMDSSEDKVTMKYVSELLSSGSDDNMLIGVIDWFYAPVILLYLFLRCHLSKLILSAFILIVSIQIFSFMLIDIGSIYETIIYGKNYILLAWISSYLLLIIGLVYGLLNYKHFSIQKNNK